MIAPGPGPRETLHPPAATADNPGMDPDREIELRTELWCEGLPFAGVRPPTPGERSAMSRRRRLLAWRAALAAAAALTLPAAPLPLAARPATGLAWSVAYGASLALLCIGLPLLVLVLRDLLRAWTRLGRDLRRETVLTFARPAVPEAPPTPADPGLAVLPISGIALAVDSRGRAHVRRVVPVEVAAGPEYGLRVSVPREMAWDANNPRTRFERRTLTDSEREELRRAVVELRHLHPLEWVFFALASLGLLGEILFPARPGQPFDPASGWWRVLVIAVVAFHVGRRWRLAGRLVQDLETGWVLRPVRPDARGPRPDQEFLPHSRALWRVHGAPAGWRALKRPATGPPAAGA